MKLAEALARVEGFGKSPLNRSTRNNNPGDIEWGDFAKKYGATRIEILPPHRTPRFAYFPTPSLGYEALTALLRTHYKGYTVERLMMHYAPPNENDTRHYIDLICNFCDCLPSDVIDDLL